MKCDNQKALESQSICISEFFYRRHVSIEGDNDFGGKLKSINIALWARQVPQQSTQL